MSVSQRIAEQLRQIGENKPINAQAFARQLTEAGYSRTLVGRVFEYDPGKSGRQVVGVLDNAKYQSLCHQHPASALEDRTSAAHAGDSHRVGLSGCIAVVDSLTEEAPQVCIIRENEIAFPRPFGPRLVVVENEELLLRKAAFRQFLGQECGITEADLLLGSGRRAASRYHSRLYAEYPVVHFLLDVDLAGLAIFRDALRAAPPSTEMRFLVPLRLEAIFAEQAARRRPGEGLDSDARRRLPALAGEHKDLAALAGLIHRYGIEIEQEVYLTDNLGPSKEPG